MPSGGPTEKAQLPPARPARGAKARQPEGVIATASWLQLRKVMKWFHAKCLQLFFLAVSLSLTVFFSLSVSVATLRAAIPLGRG